MSDNLSMDEAVGRIKSLTPNRTTLHSVIYTGSSGGHHYYLCVATERYDGNEMLNIRYASLNEFDDEDTWMKNGINCRRIDDLEGAIASAMQKVASGDDDTHTIDLTNGDQ